LHLHMHCSSGKRHLRPSLWNLFLMEHIGVKRGLAEISPGFTNVIWRRR
jgi:hypothetical protein